MDQFHLSCLAQPQAWSADLRATTAVRHLFFDRLPQLRQTRRGSLRGGGCRSSAATIGSASSHAADPSSSLLVDALVVRRGLDELVRACVRFTELLRAPKASLSLDRVRFILLDVKVSQGLNVQTKPVLFVLGAIGEPLAHSPFNPTQSRVHLESVGPLRNFFRFYL